jgi:hypothetical protein
VSEPILYTVDSVAPRMSRGTLYWSVHKTAPDGSGHGHAFPTDTLEWRAAEYGLTDIDEILDMILHEPHLPDEPDRDDAAARAGFVTSTRPNAEPITLFNARSSADALTAHRLRITDAKQTRAHVRPPTKGKDPLDTIRAAHGITPAGLRAKREAVDIQRWQLVYGDLPVRPPSPSSLLEVPRA